MARLHIPRLVIAGAASGVGKTTVTVALARALTARGLRIAVFKCGPDYLDPTYHARASGRACHNLDGWMMGREAVRATFARASAGADLALIEGVMGLFDGVAPTSDVGSTAEIARWLEAPVLVVLDGAGVARTVAALAAGLASFDPALEVAGVIANRVGGRSHLELLDRALAAPAPAGLRCPRLVGGFPVEATLTFPARHLGLRTAGEHAALEDQLTAWGERAAAWCDLDALLGIAGRAEPIADPIAAAPANPPTSPPTTASAPAPGRVRIAVAQDEAFHFYYEDNLRRLELAGAELVRFSPLADGELPPGIAGVYLGGGYPELHAERLADNAALRAAMRTAAAAGVPIYGECGGLMYLCEAIETRDGRRHPMLGLLPGVAVMQERLVALGYVEVETQVRTLLGGAGTRFRGHQFRYSQLRDLPGDLEHAFRVRRRRDGSAAPEGYRRGSVLGTYVHAHWASNPQAAAELVAACAGREVG